MEKTTAIFHTVENKLPRHGKKTSTSWKETAKSSTPWKENFHLVEKNLPHHGKNNNHLPQHGNNISTLRKNHTPIFHNTERKLPHHGKNSCNLPRRGNFFSAAWKQARPQYIETRPSGAKQQVSAPSGASPRTPVSGVPDRTSEACLSSRCRCIPTSPKKNS